MLLLLSRRAKFPSFLYCASSLLHPTGNSFASSFSWKQSAAGAYRRADFTRMAATTSPDDIIGKTVVPVADAISLQSSSTSNIKFIDGSWFLMNRNGREEFQNGPRIKGAQFFDIDDIATKSHLPHMMPPKQLFASTMDAMGISNTDHIIVYGSQDCMFVHRAWFQIRNMGHGKDYCHVLDGSISDWKDQGGPIEEGEPSTPIISAKNLDLKKPTAYQAMDAQNVVDLREMKELVQKDPLNADAIVVDARSKDRFLGLVEEPRPGMRLGHMPGAKNLFFLDLLDPENVNKLKPKDELQQLIKKAGIDISTSKRIIASCGSGATACTVVAALELCGMPAEQCYVYDGSWSEWGALDDTPIVKD